jgi:KDO2-lipid IV(A) lauroyltransferase
VPDSTKAYLFAFRHAVNIPSPALRALAAVAADAAWLMRGSGVRMLERNYARIHPNLTRRDIRTLSRAGMRSYTRYFCEAFTLHGLTEHQIAARVRVEGGEHIEAIASGVTGAAVALGHLGNWDLAGAWSARNFAPVLTVAEKLQPPELYDEFVRFRRSLGIDVLGLGDDGVFSRLVDGLADHQHRIVPLLADRDLTARGVEVDFCGHRARVAAGPATVALAAQVPLIPLGVYYEKLTGSRRRDAGSPWGIVLDFHPPIPVPDEPDLDDAAKREHVKAMTQAWVDALGRTITAHTEDWHMLQKVFIEDLDPERYAQTLRDAQAEGDAPAAGDGQNVHESPTPQQPEE